MRDIKFRAWDGRSMQFGGFSIHATGKFEPCQGLSRLKGDSIIMQFTGLTDKNGVDIYEGDILSAMVSEFTYTIPPDLQFAAKKGEKYNTGNKIKSIWTCEHVDWMTFHGFRFYGLNRRFNVKAARGVILSNHIEVIGSILQNPELLESKQ